MNYALIIAVMLALIGTVYWLKPSPRQKHLSRLREQARSLGINLKFHKLTLQSKETGLYNHPTGVFYSLSTDAQKPAEKALFEIVQQTGWHQQNLPPDYSWHLAPTSPNDFDPNAFTQSLALLKDELLALMVYKHQVSMLCSESAGANAQHYLQFLQFWLEYAKTQKSSL